MRRLAAGLGLVALLAGCTSGASHGSSRSNSATSTPATRLAARIGAALDAVRTVHLDFSTTGQPAGARGSGDLQLSAGLTSGATLTEQLPAGETLRVIVTGGQTYAQLPPSLYRSSRPWLLLSTASSSALIRTLASTLGASGPSSSLDALNPVLRAATSVHGTAGHYTLVIPTARMAASPTRSALTTRGVASLTMQLVLDADDRPTSIVERVQAGGQSATTTLRLSRFDAPLSISAPPVGQVATS